MVYNKKHEIDEELKEQIYDIFQKNGFQDKKWCYGIIDTFYTTEQHISVHEFINMLEKNKLVADKKEVTLVLKLLCEFGLVQELQFEGDNYKRYEHVHPRKHHDHFICMRCKKIIEFTDKELEEMKENLLDKKGCKSLFHKLEIYGICKECRKEERIKPTNTMPLSFAHENTTVYFVHIQAGTKLKKRLTDFGFVGNEKVRIVKNSYFGPIVVSLRGVRIAIGRGEAQKVYVTEEVR